MHNSNRVLFARLRDWQQYLPQTTCAVLQAAFAAGKPAGCAEGTTGAARHVACSGAVVAQLCSNVEDVGTSLYTSFGASPESDTLLHGHWVCSTTGGCLYQGN